MKMKDEGSIQPNNHDADVGSPTPFLSIDNLGRPNLTSGNAHEGNVLSSSGL